jgi:hypothetical protein
MAKIEYDLFRAINKGTPQFDKLDGVARRIKAASADSLLHSRIQGDTETGVDGKQFINAPDVTLERYADDAPWNVLPDGGTSMHDVAGWFGYATWNYFYVPKDTEYCDDTLFIKRDKKKKWNKTKTIKGRHYTIRPKNPMRLDAYLGALDNLARAAVVKAVELGKPIRITQVIEE